MLNREILRLTPKSYTCTGVIFSWYEWKGMCLENYDSWRNSYKNSIGGEI